MPNPPHIHDPAVVSAMQEEAHDFLHFPLRLLRGVLGAFVVVDAGFGVGVDSMGTNSKRSMRQPDQ